MVKLNKHDLDFEMTCKYVEHNLKQTNMLSSILLEIINFKEGYFFTLLPENANIASLYTFEIGILPENPIIEYFISGKKSTYSLISNIRNELSNFILEKIKKNTHISCVFDDVSSIFTPDLQEEDELFSSYGMAYNKEVYYLLTKESSSKQLIEECLRRSNAFWHSLCVLTTADFNEIKKKLTLEKIKDICLNTEMIIVGAYDSEGYVFWEKEQKFIE